MLGDPHDPNSLSTKLRRRRDVALRALIEEIFREQGSVQILDVGGTFEYWNRVGVDFLRSVQAKVTLLNLEPSELSDVAGYEDVFSLRVGNGCDLAEYRDRQFDLTHSNSVIEHVITWENMKSFAREVQRVSRVHYIQTPYFWFPIDPHFYRVPAFHWLPSPVKARLLSAFRITYSGGRADVDMSFQLVDRTRLLDRRQFRFLFPRSKLMFERFAGLPKSMIAVGHS